MLPPVLLRVYRSNPIAGLVMDAPARGAEMQGGGAWGQQLLRSQKSPPAASYPFRAQANSESVSGLWLGRRCGETGSQAPTPDGLFEVRCDEVVPGDPLRRGKLAFLNLAKKNAHRPATSLERVRDRTRKEAVVNERRKQDRPGYSTGLHQQELP